MENLKEFKELINKYESITIDEIEVGSVFGYAHHGDASMTKAISLLTGFGSYTTCSLCTPISGHCPTCTYLTLSNKTCGRGVNHKTYKKIEIASTPIELQQAIQARAKHMRKLLTDYKNERKI